jgi:APA family basic amino acid/polyamine antiporter
MTVLKVALLLAFILGGFWLGRGDWHHFSQTATRWTTTSVWRQFAVSLFWIYVAYSGWNAATYVAEEIKNPERTLGRALALGTAVVTILYLALNTVFLYATPLESMKGVVAIGALAASHLFGSPVAGLFSVPLGDGGNPSPSGEARFGVTWSRAALPVGRAHEERPQGASGVGAEVS